MKIIHIVESFAGGVFDFLVDLINGMSEFEHIIVHGKRENTPVDYKKYFPEETNFFYWKNAVREVNPKQDLLALIELINILKNQKDIDVIHLHSSKAGFLGRLATRTLGLQNKVVYTSHGVSFLRKDVSQLKLKQFVWFEKIATKFGGRVIACSKSEAEEFRKYGIDANYIYNGIDINEVYSSNANSKDKVIIGTVGRITYPKNPKLFDEIANYFKSFPNIKFLWIGDGELKHELKSENIKITGWLSRNQALEKLKEIDIYLSTSLWEGLPLSVLQAMALSKPLILSNCVGNIDLVENNYNGFLFKDRNEAIRSIENLLADKNLIQNFGENSYKMYKAYFTLNKMVESYKNLYLKIKEGIS
ncbi:glycosyltransferase [Persephonella sp. IF05-L8]|uniref:glycosyltransferase n=1 Tax=Persephonella sp. IF05-L8 TaxID=1158338 RepID=UPI00068EAE07